MDKKIYKKGQTCEQVLKIRLIDILKKLFKVNGIRIVVLKEQVKNILVFKEKDKSIIIKQELVNHYGIQKN